MTQTTSEHRLSRRFALKGAGVLAAALAVPAAVAAPTVEASGEAGIVHTAACFHRVHRLDTSAIHDELRPLWKAFEARVPDDVWSLHDRIVTLEADLGYEAQNAFVAELCRHFPGLAPAVRAIAYHLMDQRLDDIGACCEDCDPERCPGGGAAS